MPEFTHSFDPANPPSARIIRQRIDDGEVTGRTLAGDGVVVNWLLSSGKVKVTLDDEATGAALTTLTNIVNDPLSGFTKPKDVETTTGAETVTFLRHRVPQDGTLLIETRFVARRTDANGIAVLIRRAALRRNGSAAPTIVGAVEDVFVRPGGFGGSAGFQIVGKKVTPEFTGVVAENYKIRATTTTYRVRT